MNITYYYGQYDEDEIELDLSESEIIEAITSRISKEQIIKDAEGIYKNYTQEEKQEVLKALKDAPEFITNGEPDITKLADDDLDWVVETFLFDDLDSYKEDVEIYYEDRANEQYKDNLDYKRNPDPYR